MGLMTRVLKNLLPSGGAPWLLAPTFRALIEGLSVSLQRAKDVIDGILTESLPSTAVDTLPEWFGMLGIPYDATQTLTTRQNRAKAQWVAFGGQSLDYLNGIIQIAYPDVEIETVQLFCVPDNMVGYGEVGKIQATDYPSWLTSPPTDGTYPYAYYRLIGEVPDVSDLNRLLGLMDRIAPAEMEPVLAVDIINITETAEVGLGMVGLMEVGRERT